MLIFWDQRLALLATPKTGSTSLEVALESLATVVIRRPPELKHTNAQRYQRFLGPFFEKSAGERFTVVALMREPVSWLGSWYRYRQRGEVAGSARHTGGMSFDAFVTGYMTHPRPAYADVGSQIRFLSKGDQVVVDRLFAYEDLDAFLHYLEERLKCAILLPRMNVSPPGDLALSPATEAGLRRHSAADFALHDRVLRREF